MSKTLTLLFLLIASTLWAEPVKGSVQMDQYKHELVLSARDMVEIKAKNVRKDLMPEDQKRVEFHAHTNMSTMDAIPDVTDLVAQAARWGHQAIAITDHAGAQSFPHAHSAGGTDPPGHDGLCQNGPAGRYD